MNDFPGFVRRAHKAHTWDQLAMLWGHSSRSVQYWAAGKYLPSEATQRGCALLLDIFTRPEPEQSQSTSDHL